MVKSNIVIENAKIGFKNFSGKEGKFNPAGRRNFCVFLESELAESLESDGWNIRWLDPKDPDADRQAYLQVAVSYDNIPPKIVMISSKGQTALHEETIGIVDWAEIDTVDLIIRPYNWTMHEGTRNEKRGVKAYIKSMYITIVEDVFESKYINTPDSATDSIGGCGNCETCNGEGHCKHDKEF